MKTFAWAIAPVLAGLSIFGSTQGIAQGTAQSAQPRPAAFAACAACHAVDPGKKSFGPNLHGVFGRKSASLADYPYSPALKASGLTWDRQTLDAWLTSPRKKVPGTKMPFAGLPDPAKRKEVIDYLQRLK